MPRVSDAHGRLPMLSEAGTPFTEDCSNGPPTDSTAADSSGWAPGERPQVPALTSSTGPNRRTTPAVKCVRHWGFPPAANLCSHVL